MSIKDPDRIAAIEKAISQKYGNEAIKNPKSDWTEEKEKEYLSQMKELYEKIKLNNELQDKVDINGIKISKKLLNKESLKTCSVCDSFSRRAKDDVCLIKFDCCWQCFEKYVDGREERWLKGWRPNN
tara:strand:- start:44 stop:424 length:381 start_codon:yes stop_codon:yes gene_type:complete